MKVRLLGPVLYNNQHLREGQVVEVPAEIARDLIAVKAAVDPKAEKMAAGAEAKPAATA